MATVEELGAAYEAAKEARETLECARSNKRRARIECFTKKLDVEITEEFGGRRDAAWRIEREAERVYREALIAEARVRLSGMGDLRREEWAQEGSSWTSNRPWKKTGRSGVLEVRDFDSRFAENLSRYDTPDFGEIYLRIYKKDGSTSLVVIRRADADRWRPIEPQQATP